MTLYETIALLRDFKQQSPAARKADLESYVVTRSDLRKAPPVYLGDGFSLRFCEANTGSFSNTVLALSKLRKYDALPVVVCIVRPDRLDFRLANTTFLRRISHSSHTVREDKIRGSFNGSGIVDSYEGISNHPEQFEDLFARHRGFTWEENVARLIEANKDIVPRSTRFPETSESLACLLDAPNRASLAPATPAYREAERELSSLIEQRHDELLRAAELNNVNIRGNKLEQIITGKGNTHRLDDMTFPLANHGRLVVDIKTKLLGRASAPKAYNIDKMLRLLADPANVFCFFFVGLDLPGQAVRTCLISIFDPLIIEATRIQTHWAGRSSRGVTQLTGDLTRIFSDDYRPSVDIAGGENLLRLFVER